MLFKDKHRPWHQTEYLSFEVQMNVIKKKPIKVVVAQLGLGQNE